MKVFVEEARDEVLKLAPARDEMKLKAAMTNLDYFPTDDVLGFRAIVLNNGLVTVTAGGVRTVNMLINAALLSRFLTRTLIG